MDITELTNLTIGFLILIGGIAVGLKKFIFGNGKKNGRATLTSVESKEEFDKLWEEKQGKALCDQRYEELKDITEEVREEQKYVRKLMTNVAIKVQAEIPQ